uniref:Uncharacterized protein n=1 Tax=viral metagenome TaxID=1070528 RepID=A0A6C0AE73_9ZZZZ
METFLDFEIEMSKILYKYYYLCFSENINKNNLDFINEIVVGDGEFFRDVIFEEIFNKIRDKENYIDNYTDSIFAYSDKEEKKN